MNDLIEVKFVSSKKGRGVIAKRNIPRNTLVDIAHIILVPNKDFDLISETILYDYTFTWEDPADNGEFMCAIPLSVCQFINHSYKPNIEYFYDYENKTIEFYTIKRILKGEELTVNYNGVPKDKSPLWFEVED
ncbi:MAG: SET domain-containing protein-lysine N-methyltransferase [Candidatus Lokiarchaeota archaeon]|nr:SET domain-containing protein-lysine N-methyltransferase [Candidatus Lokiarchaeota archaeon]MBD3342035.1 SET domain-containing protein-lysine N-methyltransferase [Candidatus Lokiarchaeota archaeon]